MSRIHQHGKRTKEIILMIRKPIFWGLPLALLAAFFLIGCGGGAQNVAGTDTSFASDSPLYTRYNIHTQNQVRRNGDHILQASYANYTNPGHGHVIIPAGSKIEITSTSRRNFIFQVAETGAEVEFECHEPRMGMSVQEYIQKITSSEPISLAGLSEIDRRGVQEGKALVGMSREGVVAALGYPAAHRTPSLDSPTYVYWTNRFGTIAVDFDEQGKVKKVKQ